MTPEPNPGTPAVFDPATWMDLLAAYAEKKDGFSSRTLVTLLDGIEKLAEARAMPGNAIVVTAFHTTLFERLQTSFNNPTLLKEIGMAYLGEFGLPDVARKHFEVARHFAPNDRSLEELERSATIALAKQTTDQPNHTPISDVAHPKLEIKNLMRKTTRIDLTETRRHLTEAAGELDRQQEAVRKSGPVAARKQPTEDIGALLDFARKLTKHNDFAGAANALVQARDADAPKEELLAVYSQLGVAVLNSGDIQEALDIFVLARDLDPESLDGWFNCALVYQEMGRHDEALQAYQEASLLAPENAKVWCNLSSVWFELHNYRQAEAAARRALQLRPDYARAWDNLAATLSAENRLPEAADACRSAIRFQGTLRPAWFKLGVISFQLEQWLEAKEAFSLTGDSLDFHHYVLYYLSMIEARRGELDAALHKLSEARAADPANELLSAALKEIGAACTRFGRDVTAADFYEQITMIKPGDFSAWLALGTALHRAGQLDKAGEAYAHATALQPNSPLPWHNLGLLASDRGDHHVARDCFRKEVELCPNDAKAWFDLALSLQSLQEEEESVKAFERAETLANTLSRRSSDLSAALSIVRRLNLGDRVLRTE